MTMKIALIDPGRFDLDRNSPNIGDLIISRASHREIRLIFGEGAAIYQIPSHSILSSASYKVLEESDFILVGGSNLLWFRLFPHASWPLRLRDLFRLKNVISLGVGWGSYGITAGFYSKFSAQKVFNPYALLSARDSYTADIMRGKLGLKNAINTGCHTTWQLSENEDDYIQEVSSCCVFSLTDYAKSPRRDKMFLGILERIYGSNLIFWPQGSGDMAYAKALGYTGDYLEEDLASLIEVFSASEKPDYVGTRLHAGILAMELGVRSVTIAVDNRATEIGKDINLNLVQRNDIDELENMLTSRIVTSLKLRNTEINLWKAQFNGS